MKKSICRIGIIIAFFVIAIGVGNESLAEVTTNGGGKGGEPVLATQTTDREDDAQK